MVFLSSAQKCCLNQSQPAICHLSQCHGAAKNSVPDCSDVRLLNTSTSVLITATPSSWSSPYQWVLITTMPVGPNHRHTSGSWSLPYQWVLITTIPVGPNHCHTNVNALFEKTRKLHQLGGTPIFFLNILSWQTHMCRWIPCSFYQETGHKTILPKQMGEIWGQDIQTLATEYLYKFRVFDGKDS